jgi:tetratricopeptide (TPR) repeat protein
LQKSTNFDEATAVDFGKLAGVKYVMVGSVYVLEGVCSITSRMVDVETSEIVLAKESSGAIADWLALKSELAEEFATAMNNPITIGDDYTTNKTTEGVLLQYGKVIDKMDEGDTEGAQQMAEMLSSVQPDFKYFDELKLDIEELKKQVKENTADIESLNQKFDKTIENPIQEFYKLLDDGDVVTAESYLELAKSRLDKINKLYGNDILYLRYAEAILENYKENYGTAIELHQSILKEFPYYFSCRKNLIMTLIKSGAPNSEVDDHLNFLRRNYFKFGTSSVRDEFPEIALEHNNTRRHTAYFDFFDFVECKKIMERLNTDSYELKEDELWVRNLDDNYLFINSYYFDITLSETSFVQLLVDMASTYCDIGKNNKGIEIFAELLKKYSDLISDYKKNSEEYLGNWPFNFLGDTEKGIVTNSSWYLSKAKIDSKTGDKWVKYMEIIGVPTMAYINLGHWYDSRNMTTKAKQSYCRAFDDNRYTNVREIIEIDREELGLSGKLVLDCK